MNVSLVTDVSLVTVVVKAVCLVSLATVGAIITVTPDVMVVSLATVLVTILVTLDVMTVSLVMQIVMIATLVTERATMSARAFILLQAVQIVKVVVMYATELVRLVTVDAITVTVVIVYV